MGGVSVQNLILPFCCTSNTVRSTIFRKSHAKFCYLYGATTSPGEERATRLTLTDLQTDDSGLEIGALFQQDGFVKITRTNVPRVRGSVQQDLWGQ